MHIDGNCKYCSIECDGQDIINLSCGDLYHKVCLEEWIVQCNFFNLSPTCPCCRKKIESGSIEQTFNIKINGHKPLLNQGLKLVNGFLESYELSEVVMIINQQGINIYSFALTPGDYQPSGTCNFSRMDNTSLNVWFDNKKLILQL